MSSKAEETRTIVTTALVPYYYSQHLRKLVKGMGTFHTV